MDMILESDAAAQLGIPRQRLAELRQELPLKRGREWRNRQGAIYLTAEGCRRVTEALEGCGAPDEPPPAEAADEGPQDGAEGETVAEVPPPGENGGVDAVGVAIEGKSGEEETPPEALGALKPPAVLDAVVAEVPRQRKVLVCVVDGERVSVRCRDNGNFIPGMRCRVRRPVVGWIWFLEGRLPRRRGHW